MPPTLEKQRAKTSVKLTNAGGGKKKEASEGWGRCARLSDERDF